MSNILCAFACNENFSSQPHTLFLFSQSWFAFRAYTLINGTLSVYCSAIIWLRTLLFIEVYILQPLLCDREYAACLSCTFLNAGCLQHEKICLFWLQSNSKDSSSLRSALRFMLAPIVGRIQIKIRKLLPRSANDFFGLQSSAEFRAKNIVPTSLSSAKRYIWLQSLVELRLKFESFCLSCSARRFMLDLISGCI